MSRSYKKTPYCGLKKNREIKRIANKRFRSKLNRMRIDDQIAPSMFKRFFELWDICDFYTIETLQEWMISCRDPHGWRRGVFNEKEEIRKWHKWYRWK